MRPKTDQLGRDTTVVITSQRDINVCPVKKLKEYLLERGSYSGPLFCHFDKTPLSRYQFNAVLKKALAYLNIPAQGYQNHSFRIGMATALCTDRRSDEEIKRMGRWKSSAFQGYIRVC
jgi:site-specific recombinase XerD